MMRWRTSISLALVAAWLALPARAAVSTGQPASLLVFPWISVEAGAVDTVVRLTNLGDAPQTVRCTYVDGSLVDGTATSFTITLTPEQPIAWHAGAGLATLPVDGVAHPGTGGAVNSGMVPPVPAMPFSGVLRCVAAEPDGTPTASDTLIGTASIERGAPVPDAVLYKASGFLATGTSADEPSILVLGGPTPEYDACPESLTLQPFLDGASIELGADGLTRETATTMVLATCGSTLGGAAATIDLALTDELGQQFSARRTLREHLVTPLSRLDTSVSSASIFNSATFGSTTGNLRITPVSPGSGVLALAITGFVDPAAPATVHRAALETQFAGERPLPDLVDIDRPTPNPTMPPTPTVPSGCTGDCNGDGGIAINELISGVNIALGNAALSTCLRFDANGDGRVTINELIAAVNNALTACA